MSQDRLATADDVVGLVECEDILRCLTRVKARRRDPIGIFQEEQTGTDEEVSASGWSSVVLTNVGAREMHSWPIEGCGARMRGRPSSAKAAIIIHLTGWIIQSGGTSEVETVRCPIDGVGTDDEDGVHLTLRNLSRVGPQIHSINLNIETACGINV